MSGFEPPQPWMTISGNNCIVEDCAITPPKPERAKILEEGASLIAGKRDEEYGAPSVNLACAGELKAVLRKHMQRDISPAEMEALDQVCTKLGRIVTGRVAKRDSYVDMAGYAGLAGEIALSG